MRSFCFSACLLLFVFHTNIYAKDYAAGSGKTNFAHSDAPSGTTMPAGAPFTMAFHHHLNAGLDSVSISCTITATNGFRSSNSLQLLIALEEERNFNHLGKIQHALVRTRLSGSFLPAIWQPNEHQNVDFSAPLPGTISDFRRLSMRATLWSADNSIPIAVVPSVPIQFPVDLVIEGVQGLDLLHCNSLVEPVLIFKNGGADTLYSCSIRFSYDDQKKQYLDWNGVLPPGFSTAVYLPTSNLTPGKHEFVCSIWEKSGKKEKMRDNNSIRIPEFFVVDPAKIPLTLNFQPNYQNKPNRPTPFILHNDPHSSARWEVKGGMESYGKTGKALSLNLTQTEPGAHHELILPVSDFDKLSRPIIDFNYAYFQQNHGNLDQLDVLISTDCGLTWSSVWTKEGSALATAFPSPGAMRPPSKKDWRSIRLELFEMVNQPDFLLKFSLTSDLGNALYLDDIAIYNDTTLIETNLTLAPNPCQGLTQFSITDAGNEEYTLKVFNTNGQIVFIELIEATSGDFTDSLNLLHLPNGVYPVCLYNKTGLIGNCKQLAVQK
ncbi:MAG: T9SS type A sorting domain-containing protein [Bacteroidetes bacterium]|nr:T9SS type A sorting domain-containing protein [Bacteroidota bacterium]